MHGRAEVDGDGLQMRQFHAGRRLAFGIRLCVAIGMPGRVAFRIAGGAALIEGGGARFLADGVEFFLRRVFQRRGQLFFLQFAVWINFRVEFRCRLRFEQLARRHHAGTLVAKRGHFPALVSGLLLFGY